MDTTNYISDYTFNNTGRLGSDECCIDQTTIQNTLACNHMLQNFYVGDCSMSNPIRLATSQPCINYKGSYGNALCGLNIDDSSKLLIGSIQTQPKCHISLFQRPFATVPYLGRGSVCPILESQLQQGEMITSKNSITQLTEKNYNENNTVPLIPSIQKTINNPNNLVEEVADENWIRGGIDSRNLTRDKNFYTTHTPYQYV